VTGVADASEEISENAGSGVGATAVFDAGAEGISNGISDGIVVPAGHVIVSAG
jgi:hypothetical protein